MKKILIALIILCFAKVSIGQINTDPQLSQTSEDSLPTYANLSQNEKIKVERLRNANYFSETVSTFIPLSKTSFWLSKRFTGNSFTDRKTI